MTRPIAALSLLAGLGLAMAAISHPALAATKKKPMMHGHSAPAAMSTTDELNAQSLAAAQAGKSFSPAAEPMAPAKSSPKKM